MLNNTHFTNLAGNPEPWDDEMTDRRRDGEDLCDLQVDFHGRGRREAEVVKGMNGFYVRLVSGLNERQIVVRGWHSYDEAVRLGTEWAETDPVRRSLMVRNSNIPTGA
tara:strand:- start:7675 stop:7998 length:324 start_codon:yes stop_codon:yes gene_type:complete